MKIALSAGHQPTQQGAHVSDVSEYGITCQIIGESINLLSKLGHEAWLIGAGFNVDQVKQINELDCDCGLELHFNSFSDPKFRGTEVLHAGSRAGIQLAGCLQKSLVASLKTKDRGIKIGYYQLNPSKPLDYMLERTNCPFVIVEPLFLSNPDDFLILQKSYSTIACAIVDGLIQFTEFL